MNRDSLIDYCGCILLRVLGPIIRMLPLGFSLFLGRRLGDLSYYFDLKHKTLAYANIKAAFLSQGLSPSRISQITRQFYRSFGQNLVEVFNIPLVNRAYLDKYIRIEGLNYITEGFKRGKGVIFVGIHEGSWELYNIICANLGFPFFLFVAGQRYPRLNRLLNAYRTQRGCRIVPRGTTRDLIQVLKDNQAVGMMADQGGRTGALVKFFGKNASLPTGALKLALKYDACIIPAFYTRINGPYAKIILEPIFELKKTGDHEKDIRDNLQRLTHIFEEYIRRYPQEYLWTYKVWKYTNEKSILILNDAKTGHNRQSQAVANIVCGYLKEKGIKARVNTIDVEFKQKFSGQALLLSSCLAGKYRCQGCLWCLRTFLKKGVYGPLISQKPDIVISCGSGIAPVNYIISRENIARSIVVMKPSILSMHRFNLVIMPRHDRPPKRKNVVVTEGALNLIDEEYMKEQVEKLVQGSGFRVQGSGFYIGVLIGGDTKNFVLSKDTALEVCRQIKSVAEKLNADILVTTSRRTRPEIENLIKQEFAHFERCKLLVIANEKNIPSAVGGILSLSQVIIISPESISMISEAVNSKKYVVAFEAAGLDRKHQRFLDYFAQNKYIYLTEADNLSKTVEGILTDKPLVYALKDNLLVREALARIL